jgi:hypothetical protein
MKANGWVVLTDDASTLHALVAQTEARVLMQCSVCEAPLGSDEADASQRCNGCRP